MATFVLNSIVYRPPLSAVIHESLSKRIDCKSGESGNVRLRKRGLRGQSQRGLRPTSGWPTIKTMRGDAAAFRS